MCSKDNITYGGGDVMRWWLYSKQEDVKTRIPSVVIILGYIIAIALGVILQVANGSENRQVNFSFFVLAVFIPVSIVSTLLFIIRMAFSMPVHYAETRKYIAKQHEFALKRYARKHLAIAAWSVITPLEQPALNLLNLEGEFPLAPKTPLKIAMDDLFDQTRNEQVFTRLLAPMADMLKSNDFRDMETAVWVSGSDHTCVEELKRSRVRLNIPDANSGKIDYLPVCPDYAIIGKWLDATEASPVNRLLIVIDMHSEDSGSKSMESASAFLLTHSSKRLDGVKPVYLYQPMTGVTEVEEKMTVYLDVESVPAAKTLWFTGLSRAEKYPLLQALDSKGLASERLDIDASLGEKSAGYRWLSVALAADAVKYAQGNQLVAASGNNQFAIVALSSRQTPLPEKYEWIFWNIPYLHGVIAGLFCGITIVLFEACFTSAKNMPSLWVFLFSASFPLLIFATIGFFFTQLIIHQACEDMGN